MKLKNIFVTKEQETSYRCVYYGLELIIRKSILKQAQKSIGKTYNFTILEQYETEFGLYLQAMDIIQKQYQEATKEANEAHNLQFQQGVYEFVQECKSKD